MALLVLDPPASIAAWRQQPPMPLILRVPTDFRKPPLGRPCRDYDVVSVTVRWYVGRIFTEQMAQGERWRWSITSVFMEGMPSSGYTDTFVDAKRDLPPRGALGWRRPAGTSKRIDRATDRRRTLGTSQPERSVAWRGPDRTREAPVGVGQ